MSIKEGSQSYVNQLKMSIRAVNQSCLSSELLVNHMELSIKMDCQSIEAVNHTGLSINLGCQIELSITGEGKERSCQSKSSVNQL